MRSLALVVSFFLQCLVVAAVPVDDALLGVFSNEQAEFRIMTLMVHESGRAYLHYAVAGQIGEWQFDKAKSVLSFKASSASGKEASLHFKFDRAQRSYLLLAATNSGASHAELTLHFVTNYIPKEYVQAFKEYPEKMKQARERFAAEEMAKKAYQAKLERERPEYERTLARIKANPSVVLAKEFYGRGDTPVLRAFQASLKDPKIWFPEDILVALLEQLPENNFWIRELIFARQELSPATLEQFYPKALVWGKEDYSLLANIATHPNTPIAIVRDLANHPELPVGATNPAQQRLKKMEKQAVR